MRRWIPTAPQTHGILGRLGLGRFDEGQSKLLDYAKRVRGAGHPVPGQVIGWEMSLSLLRWKTTKFKLCTFRPEVVIFDFLKSVQQFLKVIILMYITLFQELTTINNHDPTLKTTPFWLDLRFSIEITSERSTLLNNNLFLSSKQKSTWLYNYPFSSCIVMLAS